MGEKRSGGRTMTHHAFVHHDHAHDPLVRINDAVYAVSALLPTHPGLEKVLTNHAGRDATDVFNVFHPPKTIDAAQKYRVARLVSDEDRDAPVKSGKSACAEEFRRLHKRMLEEGWFETDMRWYAVKIAIPLAIFVTSIYIALTRHDVMSVAASAALMGLAWQQFSFIGHDVCHNSMTHVRAVDYPFASYVLTPMFGISPSWWKLSHNVHHIVTNSLDYDPDIQHLPVFSISTWQFKGFLSHFHDSFMAFDAIARVLVKYQHYLYYPIMGVARANLYLQSLIYLFKAKRLEYRYVELFMIAFFFYWYSHLTAQFPSTALRVLFVVLSHAVSGILHVQITLSHFSMGVYEGVTYNNDDDDFWHTQVATSMNIDTNWATEWFHGGLQYQVEHHLFPRLPRHRLSKIKPFVMAICEKYGLNYRSVSFVDANIEVIRSLKETALRVDEPGADHKAALAFLVNGINARG